MYFKQILDELCGCASYVIASRESHEAAIVDPSVHLDEYESLLSERGFSLSYVIDTHIHADHVSGARMLAKEHPDAKLCLHTSAEVAYPFTPLSDGQELPLGQLRLKIVHTPGHRKELISLLIINPPRSPEPSMILTGDCLLVGDVGRPDFGGGDAEAQYESLARIMRLPDWVAVFPGHFEGPCGRGMCGRPNTTIGFERLYNSLARLGRQPFVEMLTSGVPARPLNMTAIEATNRGRVDMTWAMPTSRQKVDEMSPEQLEVECDSAFLIDVREPGEFHHGYVPRAQNIPQAEIASRLDEIPREGRVALICQSGSRSYRTAQFLQEVGLTNAVSVAGGTDAWVESGRAIATGDTSVAKMVVTDTEWSHAGASPAT